MYDSFLYSSGSLPSAVLAWLDDMSPILTWMLGIAAALAVGGIIVGVMNRRASGASGEQSASGGRSSGGSMGRPNVRRR